MPELQGEPEDISKEKARIAAKEVIDVHMTTQLWTCTQYVCNYDCITMPAYGTIS